MKKWEELQWKKNYNKMLKNAKSSNLAPGSKTGKKRRYQEGTGTPTAEAPFSPSTASSMGMTQTDMSSQSKGANETLVFKLLQAFNLQQYTKYFMESGITDEVYKLALLNQREKKELLEGMKLLPGHSFKFEDLFEFIAQVYPREDAK